VQEGNKLFTSREEVELLLKKTLENSEKEKKPREGKKEATPGRIIRRIIYIILVASLLAMLGKVWLDRLSGNAPSLFGYQLYVVETGSMIPTLPIGSTIIVRQLGEGELPKIGDIITYAHESAVITHRIIEMKTDADGIIRYQTKGDNPENSADPWLVIRDDIRGVVIWHFYISLTGH
jgi:signal peptidase